MENDSTLLHRLTIPVFSKFKKDCEYAIASSEYTTKLEKISPHCFSSAQVRSGNTNNRSFFGRDQ